MLRIALFTETFLPKVDGIVNTLCHLLDHLDEREHASLLFAPRGALTNGQAMQAGAYTLRYEGPLQWKVPDDRDVTEARLGLYQGEMRLGTLLAA